MRRLVVDPANPDADAIREAAAVLRRGGLVAFPTETVYGLGASALNAGAVRRIYEAKSRPAFNPLIVHVPDEKRAAALAADWPDAARRLAAEFWPGPLTLVVRKVEAIPDLVTAGLPTVAVRVPAHPVARALLEAAGFPIAAPSANPFTAISPTTGMHVEMGLGDRVDLVLDAGPTPVGIESAVVDVTSPVPRLLRPGSIPPSRLAAVAGGLDLSPLAEDEEDAPRPSPGLTRRHYAPAATVQLFSRANLDQTRTASVAARAAGGRVGALLLAPLDADIHAAIHMPHEADAYAQRLYAALHELQDEGCTLILVEHVPDTPEWSGVRDRISRAAGSVD